MEGTSPLLEELALAMKRAFIAYQLTTHAYISALQHNVLSLEPYYLAQWQAQKEYEAIHQQMLDHGVTPQWDEEGKRYTLFLYAPHSIHSLNKVEDRQA